MVTVLASRDFIEKIFYHYNLYAESDFESDHQIDIESYLFFKDIIKGNKTNLQIDISDNELLRLKAKVGVNEEDNRISKFLSTFQNNKIAGAAELYQKLRNQDHNVDPKQLPCFLLLDEVSEEICTKIEANFGINCFSLKRMKVPLHYRSVTLNSLTDTKSSLFSELNKFNYNNLEIFDPYFLANSSVTDDCNKNTEFISRVRKNKLSEMLLKINTDLIDKFPVNEFEKRKDIFEKHLLNYKAVNKDSSLQVEFTKKAKHDRYIISNTNINIIGNSLNMNSKTFINIFPKVIYSDYNFK
ncbi:MAG: hypothetical protein IPL09_07580 [Bacteroidetes bacterium]|nr:hypothetical protein [Bacteroidota bacterium]